jgi:hypothetical protein
VRLLSVAGRQRCAELCARPVFAASAPADFMAERAAEQAAQGAELQVQQALAEAVCQMFADEQVVGLLKKAVLGKLQKKADAERTPAECLNDRAAALWQ